MATAEAAKPPKSKPPIRSGFLAFLLFGLKIIWAVFYYPLRAVYRRHFARTEQPTGDGGSSTKGTEYALLGAGYLLLAFMAVFIVMFVVAGVQVGLHRQAVQKELATCSALWDEGKRTEAVDQYKGLIEKDLASMPKSDRSIVVSRVIDYEAEADKKDSAKAYIELAQKQGIPLSLNGPKGQSLFAQVQAEREAVEREKREAAQRQKQEAVEQAEKERQAQIAAADLKKKERLEREAAEREREEKERQDKIAAADNKPKKTVDEQPKQEQKDDTITPKAFDLIDKTEDYKGKTIKMVLTYAGNGDLRGAVGSNAVFDLGNKLIWIDCDPGKKGSKIEKISDLPNRSAGDRATLTFICGQGDLKRGNRIIDIRRKE